MTSDFLETRLPEIIGFEFNVLADTV